MCIMRQWWVEMTPGGYDGYEVSVGRRALERIVGGSCG